jgi:hypothetical protein
MTPSRVLTIQRCQPRGDSFLAISTTAIETNSVASPGFRQQRR